MDAGRSSIRLGGGLHVFYIPPGMIRGGGGSGGGGEGRRCTHSVIAQAIVFLTVDLSRSGRLCVLQYSPSQDAFPNGLYLMLHV